MKNKMKTKTRFHFDFDFPFFFHFVFVFYFRFCFHFHFCFRFWFCFHFCFCFCFCFYFIFLVYIFKFYYVTSRPPQYTNADLKTPVYVCVHIKTIPWKFCALNLTTSRVTKGTVQKYSEKTLFRKFAANLQQNTPWWRAHAEVQFQYKVASKLLKLQLDMGVLL